MFSSSFTQHKVVKGQIFTTALPKDKSNPVMGWKICNVPQICHSKHLLLLWLLLLLLLLFCSMLSLTTELRFWYLWFVLWGQTLTRSERSHSNILSWVLNKIVIFLYFINYHNTSIMWLHCMVKFHRILKFLFSATLSGSCHALFSPSFSQNCQCTYLPTLSCLCLYSFWASMSHSLTVWDIVSFLVPHILQRGYYHYFIVFNWDLLHARLKQPLWDMALQEKEAQKD